MRIPSIYRINPEVPPKGGTKREFLIFTYVCVAFHIVDAGNRIYFKFGTRTDHSN